MSDTPDDIIGRWQDRTRTVTCTETAVVVATEDGPLTGGTTERIPYTEIEDCSAQSAVWSPLVQYGVLMTVLAAGFAIAVPLLDADAARTILSTLVAFPIVPLVGIGGLVLTGVGVRYDTVYVLSTEQGSYRFVRSELAEFDQFVDTVRNEGSIADPH